MLRFFKSFFNKKNEPAAEAPYKVETAPVVDTMIPVVAVPDITAPPPATCGCGRSASGFCVGLHKLTAEEWAVHAENPNKAEPVIKKKPAAKKAPATKAKASAKPAAITAAPKKARAKKEAK